jgi:hypothetical protein
MQKQTKTSSIIALSFIVLSFAGCSKGGDSGSTTPPKDNTKPDAAIAFDVKIDGAVVNYTGNFPVVGLLSLLMQLLVPYYLLLELK